MIEQINIAKISHFKAIYTLGIIANKILIAVFTEREKNNYKHYVDS